jgi:hypothetical protein
MKDTVIIGKPTLSHDEVLKLYFEHKYIITYSAIYQLFYSNAQRRAYSSEIYRGQNLTRRGTYRAATAAEVNELLQFDLLRTDDSPRA